MNINDITDTKEEWQRFRSIALLNGKTIKEVLAELIKEYIKKEG